MIQIKGLKEAQDRLSRLGVKVRYAAAKALNETVLDIQARERKEISTVFDRPTPWIQRAVKVKNAQVSNLTAKVYISDAQNEKGVGMSQTAADVLRPHIYGGKRGVKAMELYLRSINVLKYGQFLAIHKDAWTDQYGNIPGPEIVKMLSDFQAFRELGFKMNRVNGKKSRGKLKNFRYYVKVIKGVPIGIWAREVNNQGDQPIFNFVWNPQYKKVFDYFGIAGTQAKKTFPIVFREKVREQLRSKA